MNEQECPTAVLLKRSTAAGHLALAYTDWLEHLHPPEYENSA